jgi:hypothetical protein
VVYLPGAPATARIDLASERRASAVVFIGVGVGFTVLPILFMVFHR